MNTELALLRHRFGTKVILTNRGGHTVLLLLAVLLLALPYRLKTENL
jgi:hypothetical protein